MVGIAFLLLLSVQFVSVSACETGWLEFNGRCYRFDNEIQTVEDAETICQASEAQLPAVDSAELNQWLLEQMRNRSIGNIWIIGYGWTTNFEFVPRGHRINKYENWDQGEPKNKSKEQCVLFKSPRPYKWTSKECGNHNSFICEKLEHKTGCETGFQRFQGHCYSFGRRLVDWWQAKVLCMKVGGVLAEIYSPWLDAWLGRQAATITPEENYSTGNLWKGNFWIGGSNKYTVGRKWEWVTSHNLMQNFVNWMPGEPNHVETERCMMMVTSANGQWCSEPCIYTRSPFVCEKAIPQ